jgi:hypothetical protein
MTGIVRGASALGLVAAGLLLTTSPAWSDERTADERLEYTRKTCERIIRHRDTGKLEKATVPAPGSQVHSGDVIKVRLTWEVAKWHGARLHKAIDCVAVNGVLDMKLTVEEKPTSNDGVFEHEFTVPDGLASGSEICDQGFISGDSPDGEFDQDTSEVVCFTVGPAPDRGDTSPTTTSTTAQPAAPPTTVTTVAPVVQGEQEQKAAAPAPSLVQAGPPAPPAAAPAPAAKAAPQPELAATGGAGMRALAITSGLGMIFGGLGLLGGARSPSGGRRRR